MSIVKEMFHREQNLKKGYKNMQSKKKSFQ